MIAGRLLLLNTGGSALDGRDHRTPRSCSGTRSGRWVAGASRLSRPEITGPPMGGGLLVLFEIGDKADAAALGRRQMHQRTDGLADPRAILVSRPGAIKGPRLFARDQASDLQTESDFVGPVHHGGHGHAAV